MKIKVSDKWLKACGKEYLSGKLLDVIKIRDFGERGVFYTVRITHENNDWHTQWEIWDRRGIEVIEK